jgi:hypothetical protein
MTYATVNFLASHVALAAALPAEGNNARGRGSRILFAWPLSSAGSSYRKLIRHNQRFKKEKLEEHSMLSYCVCRRETQPVNE